MMNFEEFLKNSLLLLFYIIRNGYSAYDILEHSTLIVNVLFFKSTLSITVI